MIIDKKGRIFGKVSIIDVFIVVLVMAVLAGAWYRFTKSKTPTPFVKTDKIRVEFFVEEMPDFAVNAVKIGDPVKESVQNTGLGRVVDIKKDSAIRWVETDKGEYVKTSREGYLSALVTIEAQGFYGSNGVSINNVDYYIGRTLTLYVGNAALYGRISALEKIE